MNPFRITGCLDLLEISSVISTAQYTSQQMHVFFITLSASEDVDTLSASEDVDLSFQPFSRQAQSLEFRGKLDAHIWKKAESNSMHAVL